MNPVRLMTMAALCREVVLPAGVVAWLAVFGSAHIEHTRARPIINHLAPALAANAEFAGKPKAIATNRWQALAAAPPQAIAVDEPHATATDAPQAVEPDKPLALAAIEPQAAAADQPQAVAADNAQAVTIGNDDVAAASAPATEAATDTTPAAREAEPVVTAALTDPAETLPAEAPPVQASTPSAASPDSGDVKEAVDTVETLDECYVVDACIDRYLWALYQRTPKEDAVKQEDHRKVTVKRKGKLVSVTRTITNVVDEDFAWKDPKAAEKAGLSLPDYVIGGMDQDFKLKLFHMLLAAEQAGLAPGITSAFRDDYRQSIASGLKAANDRSYHGGSFRGGYGHGLAADIVSVKGDNRAQRQASSEILWKWIDDHAAQFDIARPYRDRDPPHCGPLDGQEYADHNRARKPQTAATDTKKHNQNDHGEKKRQNSARSSKQKST
ncbi:MAG TPA: hypothetical protein VKR55_10650 [Bradyrhizobium sp.]|uniref:hypothetical protein n=1 Tax=Bradyrhizobium sp. TaxID=376 RepID=UPI002CABFF65|nr:hypothetical protein [Bradyrhizobium sp.]HLZ02594.1 hypothetical protein [Bradyrhizobium sp.]